MFEESELKAEKTATKAICVSIESPQAQQLQWKVLKYLTFSFGFWKSTCKVHGRQGFSFVSFQPNDWGGCLHIWGNRLWMLSVAFAYMLMCHIKTSRGTHERRNIKGVECKSCGICHWSQNHHVHERVTSLKSFLDHLAWLKWIRFQHFSNWVLIKMFLGQSHKVKCQPGGHQATLCGINLLILEQEQKLFLRASQQKKFVGGGKKPPKMSSMTALL